MFKFINCCKMANMSVVENNLMNDDDKELMEKTKENTDYMTLKGNEYRAKVVYVYDGDTVHVVFKVFGEYYRWNCRIMGVDTPELRTKNAKEKEMGYKVRDKIREILMDKIVRVKCDEFDKYGRLLIDIYIPADSTGTNQEELLSNWLINNNYAYAYDGGTKKSWDNL